MAPPDYFVDVGAYSIRVGKNFDDRAPHKRVLVRGARDREDALTVAGKAGGNNFSRGDYINLREATEFIVHPYRDGDKRQPPYVEVAKLSATNIHEIRRVEEQQRIAAKKGELKSMEADPQANAVRAALTGAASNAQRDGFNDMWKMDPATGKIVPPSKGEFYRSLETLRAQRDKSQSRIGGNLDVTDGGQKPTQRHVDGKGQGLFNFEG